MTSLRAWAIAIALAGLAAVARGDSYQLLPTGSQVVPRRLASAAVLSSGRVLLVGGSRPEVIHPLDSTEIFDPSTRQFQAGPRMQVARARPGAMPLGGERVLVAGGDTLSYIVPTAATEILDADGGSTRLGDLAIARGRDLVLGRGADGSAWALGGVIEGRFGRHGMHVERLPAGGRAWEPAASLVLPCSGRWYPSGGPRIIRAGGNEAGCATWGEEWTLSAVPTRRLVPLPSAFSAVAWDEHRAVLLSLDAAIVTDSSLALSNARRLDVAHAAAGRPQAVAIWGDDEVVLLGNALVVARISSGEVLFKAPVVPCEETVLSVIDASRILVHSGVVDGRSLPPVLLERSR